MIYKITPREDQILKLLVEDLSYVNIGVRLGISDNAVGTAIARMKQRFKIRSCIGLALAYDREEMEITRVRRGNRYVCGVCGNLKKECKCDTASI
jgi:DNA-binding CsgD family transcriptional regulator